MTPPGSNRGTRALVVSCVAATGWAVGGCTADDVVAVGTVDPATPSVTVSSINGYPLLPDPVSALEFSGNPLVFDAEVVRVGAPRQSRSSMGDYIYTPLDVRVTAVHRGALTPGSTIVVRALGGRIGDQETVTDLGLPPESFVVGVPLVIFSGEFVDTGDGLSATTPNFAFRYTDGFVESLADPTLRMPEAEFRALLP